MIEAVQQLVARVLATSKAGLGLCLIGGFRYRLLDESARISKDLDYHCDGDLEAKQKEVIDLLQRRVVPEIRRRYQYDADVRPGIGPDADSPAVRVVELAFWKSGVTDRITIPIDITRIICLDRPVVRTVAGTIYATASDADVVESKVIAIFHRQFIEHRDFCDLYLFRSHLREDSPARISRKLSAMKFPRDKVAERLEQMAKARDYHVRQIHSVVQEQLESPARENLELAGGGAMIFDSVIGLLVQQTSDHTEVTS